MIPHLHQPPRRQGGQVGRTAGATGRAVHPPRWQGGAGLVGTVVDTMAEHHVGDVVERLEQGMPDTDLPIDHLLERDTSGCQLPRILGRDGQPHLIDVHQGVVHAAKGDVGLEGAERFRLDGHVQLLDEGRHHVQRHAQATSVCAARPGGHQAGGRVKHHCGLRLLHRQHAEFEQRGDHADAVAAGHGMGLVRLQDDEACLGFWPGRRQQQVHRHLQAAARFQHHQAAQAIVHLVDVVHLVEHGLAGYANDTAGNDLADLTFAVDIHQL
ncbi:hypothetical protein D9M68_606120 [compost metagenome]